MSWRATSRVAVQRVSGELVLLDLTDGTFFVSKGLGPVVWERVIEGRVSVEAVANEIADRYGRDPASVAVDVQAFLEDLRGRGFVDRG